MAYFRAFSEVRIRSLTDETARIFVLQDGYAARIDGYVVEMS